MVEEVLYAVLGASSCYTVFHLVKAFRTGEFSATDYGRPSVFAAESRFPQRHTDIENAEHRESVT